jgi:hypothetical protein
MDSFLLQVGELLIPGSHCTSDTRREAYDLWFWPVFQPNDVFWPIIFLGLRDEMTDWEQLGMEDLRS